MRSNQNGNVSAAETIATAIAKDWQKILDSLDIGSATVQIKELFDQLAKTLKDSDGHLKADCEQLFALVDETVTPNRQRMIDNALNSADVETKEFAKELRAISEELAELHKGYRDQLSKEGLPVGGKDREAKKKAFDEAVVSLETYRFLCAQWNEMFKERNKLREILEEKCVLRTNLRKETAEDLTYQLARDLDSTVLVIEADARPVANKEEFINWISACFAPGVIMKFRSARARSIIEQGMKPAHLKDIIFSTNDYFRCLLLNNKTRAEDGKIGLDDIDKWIDDTVALRCNKLELEKSEVPEELWNDLPVEIQTGLWQFSLDIPTNGLSRLNAGLQLDEIVSDDLPEIRLNDRPTDPESKARPLLELSPGQRCSAILPILLLTGNSPLLIDQPEDNLDNRLVRQVIVNILASIKLRRQVIVATHNPNLPVLGDAEQAIILRAVRERGCELEAFGNLDSPKVVKYITDIMEGGREAFQYRQSIYQSHWDGPVAE